MKANSEIDCLKSDVAGKRRIIQQYVVIKELEREYDDVEQNGRNGFFRIFGVPENTNWDTDSKVIHVFNEMMKMDPPISMEDMEVTHRVGKPYLFSGQIDQPTPAAQPVSHGEAAEVPLPLPCLLVKWLKLPVSLAAVMTDVSSPTHISEIH